MKNNKLAPAAEAKKTTRSTKAKEGTVIVFGSPKAKRESITITPSDAQLATWKEKAAKQGFPNVATWVLYNIAAHAWPSNRLAIISDDEDFTEWNRAALKKKLTITKWIEETLNSAAFLINSAERIEAINDFKAFHKASSGALISYDEFQRSEKYRASHPEESAEADRKRRAAAPPVLSEEEQKQEEVERRKWEEIDRRKRESADTEDGSESRPREQS